MSCSGGGLTLEIAPKFQCTQVAGGSVCGWVAAQAGTCGSVPPSRRTAGGKDKEYVKGTCTMYSGVVAWWQASQGRPAGVGTAHRGCLGRGLCALSNEN